ncbi:MAG: cytochrome c biogenesis protein CcdA [Planctomycetota bacterium]
MATPSRSFVHSILVLFGTLLATASPALAQFGSDEPAVVISAELRDATVAPGDETVVAVIFQHAEGFHTYPPKSIRKGPAELISFLIAIEAGVTSPEAVDGLAIGQPIYPEPHLIPVPLSQGGSEGQEYSVYEEETVVYVPVSVPADAQPGSALMLDVSGSFQACNDQFCLNPTASDTFIEIPIGETTAVSDAAADAFAGYDAAVAFFSGSTGTSTGTSTAAKTDDAEAADVGGNGKLLGLFAIDQGLIGLVALSALGGLILNLTPCVLPVIPIKVMTLTSHAGESRAKALWLGLAMAFGVVLFWLGLGVPAALVTSFADPSQIFGYWYVTVPLGLLIIAMALGLMGMFSLNLPKQVYMVNPKADSTMGSLMFGVMTGVLGLPCFGFVAGALVPAAAALGQAQVILIFASLGAGMAAPYLVLSAFPKLLDRVPRTGPASELVKQFLGLLMVGAGVYFAGTGMIALVRTYPYLGDALHYFGVSAAVIGAAVWLVIGTFRITKKPFPRAFFGSVAVVLTAAGAWLSVGEVISRRAEALNNTWSDYTPAALAEAQAAGQVVLVDFTAEWCINCKVFEARVLDANPVKPMLESEWITPMKVDKTGPNPDGDRLLAELGRVGIPTWAIYGPGLDEPYIVSSYTPGEVSRALERARGETAASDSVASVD